MAYCWGNIRVNLYGWVGKVDDFGQKGWGGEGLFGENGANSLKVNKLIGFVSSWVGTLITYEPKN